MKLYLLYKWDGSFKEWELWAVCESIQTAKNIIFLSGENLNVDRLLETGAFKIDEIELNKIIN